MQELLDQEVGQVSQGFADPADEILLSNDFEKDMEVSITNLFGRGVANVDSKEKQGAASEKDKDELIVRIDGDKYTTEDPSRIKEAIHNAHNITLELLEKEQTNKQFIKTINTMIEKRIVKENIEDNGSAALLKNYHEKANDYFHIKLNKTELIKQFL